MQRRNDHPLAQRIRITRSSIYEKGKGVKSTAVEDLLGPHSYVPTTVCHSHVVSDGCTNLSYQECFQQAIRRISQYVCFICGRLIPRNRTRCLEGSTHSPDTNAGLIGGRCNTAIQLKVSWFVLSTINSSEHLFTQVPTFGHLTIRMFHSNASGLKKLAARDFEDLLQVIDALHNLIFY